MKLLVALCIVGSPLWFVFKVSGREGLQVFGLIMGIFLGLGFLYCTAEWALTTVLGFIGFDKTAINKDNGHRPTIIFWR